MQGFRLIHPLKNAIVGFLTLICLTSPLAAQTLALGGTGGDLGTMQHLATAFEQVNPGITVNVLPSLGSSGGIKALLANTVDIALTSRALNDKERQLGLREIPYAETVVLFATPDENPQTGLTTADITAMFAGERQQWPDGTPVRVVLRPPNSADQRLLSQYIPGLEQALIAAEKRRGVPVTFTVQEAADTIEQLHWGLGASNLSVILGEQRKLKGLSLDGIAPTISNLENGSYPLPRRFSFVVPAELGEKAQAFIHFVYSESGAAILTRTGHHVLPATP